MAKSIEHAFYTSTGWKKAREAYIEKKHGLCERCMAKGLIVPGKIVHHKKHLNKENYLQPEIALSFDNFELLCQNCHNEEHFKTSKKKRYRFGENGEMIF